MTPPDERTKGGAVRMEYVFAMPPPASARLLAEEYGLPENYVDWAMRTALAHGYGLALPMQLEDLRKRFAAISLRRAV